MKSTHLGIVACVATALPHIWRALNDYPNEPEILRGLQVIRSSISGP